MDISVMIRDVDNPADTLLAVQYGESENLVISVREAGIVSRTTAVVLDYEGQIALRDALHQPIKARNIKRGI